MTLIRYDNDPFSDLSLKWMTNGENPVHTIEHASSILSDYDDQGYTLTLRQLFYQFLSRGLFKAELMADDKAGQRVYKNFGSLITKARNNGLLSWTGIEDRGRNVNGLGFHQEDDHQVVNNLEYQLSLNFWERQKSYVEVWVEKEALINVIEKACRPLKCPFTATKGYLSASEAWRAGQRFKKAREAGKECFMIHLGDHDPEGLDMTRDNEHRLNKYSEGVVTVKRIALNMDQVEQYNPPPNYAKASSSRFDWYVSEYGSECWELDALEPRVIVDLITDEVERYVDWDMWNATIDEQDEKRFYLENVVNHWTELKYRIDELEGR